MDDLTLFDLRIFKHSWKFYMSKLKLVILFSIPFIAASLIALLVSAPSYLSVGSVFIRTGSIPEMSLLGSMITVLAYLLSIFIVSYVITNLNLLIKEKRTRTKTRSEILKTVGGYTIKIFLLFVLLKLVTVIIQLFTYGLKQQNILYPILLGIASLLFFFIPPAVVIDERNSIHALYSSIKLLTKKPLLVFGWIIIALLLISITELISNFIFGLTFGPYITMLINCLFILPFLIILQSHIYMEKYPLAR